MYSHHALLLPQTNDHSDEEDDDDDADDAGNSTDFGEDADKPPAVPRPTIPLIPTRLHGSVLPSRPLTSHENNDDDDVDDDDVDVDEENPQSRPLSLAGSPHLPGKQTTPPSHQGPHASHAPVPLRANNSQADLRPRSTTSDSAKSQEKSKVSVRWGGGCMH